MILTTTNNIEGYKITEYLGLVYAEVSGEALFGKSTEKIEKKLTDNALEKDADAIVGIKYSNYERCDIGMKFAYGTAVKIKKQE